MSDAVLGGAAAAVIVTVVHLLASALYWLRTTLTRYLRRRSARAAPHT